MTITQRTPIQLSCLCVTTLAFAGLIEPRSAGQTAPQVAAAASIQTALATIPQQPSLIDSIKKTIVFIETDCVDPGSVEGKTTKSFAGTAFLLGVPDPRLNGGAFTYLATNRHVAQPGVEVGNPCRPLRYRLHADLRSPLPSGNYASVTTFSPDQVSWTFPADPSVDLAVTPIQVNAEQMDVIFLPSTLLMSDTEFKSQHVEEGDSVLFSGLFVQLVGQTHSEPIVREGKIAMVPREPVPTTLRTNGDIFLVDCHVFGGNSGSPMFINLTGQRGGNLILGSNYKLLGVVSGYMKESSNFSLQTVAAYAGTVDANSGIATVVPAQKLLDLLDTPSLKSMRELVANAYPKQKVSPGSPR